MFCHTYRKSFDVLATTRHIHHAIPAATHMNLWRNKLLAYLHDPPHKPFQITGHEDARGPLLRAVGLTEEEIDQWHRRPDWWAAAADRFPSPSGKVVHVDWQADGHLEFRHPLSGQQFLPGNRPRAHSRVGESWIEDALHGLPTDEVGWKQKFFRVWRLWPERCAREKHPMLAYLVADTRIPDHTLWHHNALVSALQAVGEKPAFLLFQIGPVQDFISQARKMQDLWSGSYLLSFLISKALAAIALKLGPDCIIYPNLRGVPLMDWWWSQEEDLFPKNCVKLGEGRLHRNELLVPSLPNRFLALVPAGQEGREIALQAQDAVRALWNDVAKAVHDDICERLGSRIPGKKFPNWDAHWEHQVGRFPNIDWVIREWLSEDQAIQRAKDDGAPPLLGGWQDHPLYHALKWRDTIPVAHQEPWHGVRNDAFAWALHYVATEWLFAATKNSRGFASWPAMSADKGGSPKDHLNGRDEVLGGADPVAFWDALREAYGGAATGQFKGRQIYGAISVIKRLWPCLFLNKWQHCKPDFESVQDIAGQRWIRHIERAIDSEPGEVLTRDDPKYYAVLCMDGDDMGQWVSGARTPPLHRVLADKAWAYFRDGKDGQGGWKPSASSHTGAPPSDATAVRRPLSPGFHAALSEAISNFGLYCAGQVVEAFGGQLLYSGGDDVLAMLPAVRALNCGYALQCAFRGEIPTECLPEVRQKLESLFEFYPDAPGFIRCRNSGVNEAQRPNWPLMVPGNKATASVGIAIGHVRAPMQETIQAARDAENAAKRVRGKAAFSLSVLKRSGEAVNLAAPWQSGVISVWDELGAEIHDLTGRFAYRYASLVKALVIIGGGSDGASYAPNWDLALRDSVEAELRHVLRRQGSHSLEKARDLSQRWCATLTASLSPRDYLHFWLAWAFVKRLANREDSMDL